MLFPKAKRILVIVCLLIATVPFSAVAKNYKINPQFSTIQEVGDIYPPNPAEPLLISGSFTFVVEENYIGKIGNIILLKAFNIQPATLSGAPFVFPYEYFVVFNGYSFSGNSDPCSLWGTSGTCSSWGHYGGISGTINGDEMVMEGEAPIDESRSYHFTIKATTKETGDIDGNGHVDLADAVLALQTLSSITPSVTIYNEASVNTNLEIGLAESIYILQKMAGSRTDTLLPWWVAVLIAGFQNELPVGNPLQAIWRYEYKSSTVFYVPPQCCDQFSSLYDWNGNQICAPDGGIAGSGDGQCTDFFQERKNGVLVWQDSGER